MNIKNKVRSAKCGVLGALVAVGLSAFAAEPSVTVDKVESADPWDSTKGTITVNYTLGGVDAKLNYKVAFDVMAGGQTASVTNDAAKLTDGAATKEIDTATLFGKEVVDTKAKVKVSLIAIKPKKDLGGVQLWADGPFWAECNIGATKPEDYGILTSFNDAAQAVTDAMGTEWRVPTKDDFDKLVDTSYCTKTWDSDKKGYTFTGATAGYTDKSIFLPAAGYDLGDGRVYAGGYGRYRSSEAGDDDGAWYLYFSKGYASVYGGGRSYGLSVRAVRDAK